MKRFFSLICCILMLLPALCLAENSGSTAVGMDSSVDDPWPFCINHGSRDEKRIAVTMDDCYDSSMVRATFELCQQYNVPITFYPLGIMLKEDHLQPGDRELWRDIADSICEIGTHTHQHNDLTAQTPYNIILYAKYPQYVIDRLLGYHYPLRTLRPPFGHYDTTTVRTCLRTVGYHHVIRWDVSMTEANQALRDTKNGSILLYHARAKDYNCLVKLIPMLIEEGYELVTISELLGLPEMPITDELFQWDIHNYLN